MSTIISNQDVVDLARESLNDDDKVTWPDAECLKYLQDGLDWLYNNRPELFFDILTTYDSWDLTLDDDGDSTYDASTDLFPIENRYRRMLADYIIFRCETKDDEKTVDGRAKLTMEFFQKQALSA